MEFIFEAILQFLGELLLQTLFQLLVELGFYSLANVFQKSKHPIFSTIGYFLWGTIAGCISLWITPASFIINPQLRLLNLIITPLVMGGAMTLIGKLRERNGQEPIKLDKFSYAAIFAFGMSLIRFVWAK